MRISLNIIFSLLLTILSITAQPSLNYTLGPNLVSNPSFQIPSVPSTSRLNDFYSSIDSWSCKYICQIIYMPLECKAFPQTCYINSTQVLDLDSQTYDETVNQTLTLSELGWYQLSFEWIPPVQQGIGRYMQVYLSSGVVENITINSSNSVTNYAFNYSKIINITSSSVSLEFKMGATPTSYGIMIDNVAFQHVNYIPQKTVSNNTTNNSTLKNITVTPSNNSTTHNSSNNPINNTTGNHTQTNYSTNDNSKAATEDSDMLFTIIQFMMFNNFSAALNSVPGSRVFFSVVLSFYSSFDRLQLYFFHHQNLTYNSYKFISMINTLQSAKGCLLQNLIQTSSSYISTANTIISTESFIQNQLNYKLNYSDPWIGEKTQIGSYFYANNIDYLYYSVIGTLFFHTLFYFLFKLLFRYRISTHFRKYSFFAMIYFQLLQGNNEHLTFYFFQDLKSLFFFNFQQRVQNMILLVFYFFLFVFSVTGILFLYFWYRKHCKYFIENYKKGITSFSFKAFECGVIPISFGMVHSLYLQNLWIQTLLLLGLQVTFGILKVYFLLQNIFQDRTQVYIKLVTTTTRIGFIITFYCYETFGFHSLINKIHFILIAVYVLCWMMELALQLLSFIFQILGKFFSLILEYFSSNNDGSKKDNDRKRKKVRFSSQFRLQQNEQITCIIKSQHYKTYLKFSSNHKPTVNRDVKAPQKFTVSKRLKSDRRKIEDQLLIYVRQNQDSCTQHLENISLTIKSKLKK